MKVYKIIAYVYLLFGVFFLYDAYNAYSNNEVYWLKLVLAGMAIFMFVFRLRSLKRFPQNKKE
ncbi:MAG TPA: hypothetical protein VKY82_06265 [Flavobacterium sp.]|nr:hypothetical protein [Flavobacterium sp.]